MEEIRKSLEELSFDQLRLAYEETERIARQTFQLKNTSQGFPAFYDATGKMVMTIVGPKENSSISINGANQEFINFQMSPDNVDSMEGTTEEVIRAARKMIEHFGGRVIEQDNLLI